MAAAFKSGVAALVVALALVSEAGAAEAPDVSQMTLQLSDLPTAKVVSQGKVKRAGFEGAYQRTFSFSAPRGRSGLLFVQSEADLSHTTAQATAALGNIERALGSKAGRASFVAALAKSTKVSVTAVKISPLRHPKVGDHAVELPMSVRLETTRAYESVLYLRLDRVVVISILAGVRPVTPGEAASIAAAVQHHIAQQLMPAVVTLPTITGVPIDGQQLTAAPGTWNVSDATFTYQWQRCDASGSACADLPGATSQAYVVGPDDVGGTLKVVVKATNRFGSPTAESSVTPVLGEPEPPAT